MVQWTLKNPEGPNEHQVALFAQSNSADDQLSMKRSRRDAELCPPPPGLQERPQMHPTSILKDFYKFELQDQKQKKC